jgi:hypothetical protein
LTHVLEASMAFLEAAFQLWTTPQRVCCAATAAESLAYLPLHKAYQRC